jgi:TPR repeat protein
MHSNGQGVATDLAEAQRLYLKSCAMGKMNATFVAGSYYVNGKGVAQNCDEGKRLLFIAIAAKASNAMRFLGSMYDNGVCVQQDKVTAQLWYDKATATP